MKERFGDLRRMIGHDADTYGAVSGPLVAAAHGGLPAGMTDGSLTVAELDQLATFTSLEPKRVHEEELKWLMTLNGCQCSTGQSKLTRRSGAP